MSTNSDLNSRIHEKLNDWMAKLDHFQLQLSLGKKEAIDEYQEQKKTLNHYLHEAIQTAHHAKEVTAEKVESIKQILGEYTNELKKEEEASEKIIASQKAAVSGVIDKLKNA